MDGRFLLPGTVKQGYLTKSPPLDKGTSVFKVSPMLGAELCRVRFLLILHKNSPYAARDTISWYDTTFSE